MGRSEIAILLQYSSQISLSIIITNLHSCYYYYNTGLESVDTNYPHQYESISADPAKYKWYHENITEDQAHFLLRKNSLTNSFLVRKSGGGFILSYQLSGYIHHDMIDKCNNGFYLKGKKEMFESVPDLVTYYQKHSIENRGRQLIGVACDREKAGNVFCYCFKLDVNS